MVLYNEIVQVTLYSRGLICFVASGPQDIAGFTAWSSTRSPEQVFTLLQTIYQAFDKIAARRRVFKVETIGDSCKWQSGEISILFHFLKTTHLSSLPTTCVVKMLL
jgi:hypothetical protein